MIGAEARASGFNVMLAGSVNLVRDPRNGRNFEYAGEDPLLAGVMVGAQIKGIESNHIISTIKHFALNDQETDRNTLNVVIDRAQAHMSDLLAFQIAIEQSNPGSVMCAYNKVWGEYSCESAYLLNDVLRRDWGWNGYVMSDWGATHSTAKAAMSGLDQQSGYPFDDQPYFGELLLKAVAGGELKEERLTEMARRIVRTLFAKGVIDYPVKISPIDLAAHASVTRAGAEQGAVLLKNEAAILPLSKRDRAHRRHRRIRGQGRAGRWWFFAGLSSRRQRRPGPRAHRLAGTHHVLPVVAVARDPGAGARCQGAIRQRRESRSGCEAGRGQRRGAGIRHAVDR